jgi:hypothetical protein
MRESTAPTITSETLQGLEQIDDAFGAVPFTIRTAAEASFSRRRVQELVRAGLLRTVLFGVYQVAHQPLDLVARAQAAALVLPPGAAIARRTAAWLYGVDPRAPSERDQVLPVECLVPRGMTVLRRNSLRCYCSDLDATELTHLAETPCTNPTRTAADLLRWMPRHMGLAMVDALAGQAFVTADGVRAHLEGRAGHRFVDQARRLVDWIEPLTESYGESWLRLRLLDAGFPPPTAQIPILDDDGRQVFRLDLGWPERRIGIEYDGQEFHSDSAARRHDSRRRERLRVDHGWQVTGVGRGEVLGPSMRLELGIGEMLGLQPTISRRAW